MELKKQEKPIYDDIPDDQVIKKQTTKAVKRKCLGPNCNRSFITRSKFIRICDLCKNKSPFRFLKEDVSI